MSYGIRGSEQNRERKPLLYHFYALLPEVVHYEAVFRKRYNKCEQRTVDPAADLLSQIVSRVNRRGHRRYA
jgi:hypothetical protein